MKKLSLILLAVFSIAIYSCKDAATTNTSTAATTEPTEVTTPVETPAVEPAASATTSAPTTTTEATGNSTPSATTSQEPATAKPTGPITSIKFDKLEYDYGTVKDGDKVKYSYKFKNTGKEPLIISDAKGSCGCTVPDWPREPIAPGKTGEIKVEFDSKDKGTAEGTPNSKRVTITANTDPVQTYLTIKGIVKK